MNVYLFIVFIYSTRSVTIIRHLVITIVIQSDHCLIVKLQAAGLRLQLLMLYTHGLHGRNKRAFSCSMSVQRRHAIAPSPGGVRPSTAHCTPCTNNTVTHTDTYIYTNIHNLSCTNALVHTHTHQLSYFVHSTLTFYPRILTPTSPSTHYRRILLCSVRMLTI